MAAKCCGQHQSEAVVGRRYWRPRMRRGRAHQSEKGSIIEAQGTPTDETLELTFTRPSEDVSDCAKLAVTVNDHDSTAVPSKTRTSSIRPMSIDWSALRSMLPMLQQPPIPMPAPRRSMSRSPIVASLQVINMAGKPIGIGSYLQAALYVDSVYSDAISYIVSSAYADPSYQTIPAVPHSATRSSIVLPATDPSKGCCSIVYFSFLVSKSIRWTFHCGLAFDTQGSRRKHDCIRSRFLFWRSYAPHCWI